MMKASTITSLATPNSSKFRAKKLSFNFSTRLQKLYQLLLKWAIGSNEVRIWQRVDHEGKIVWHVYDPATDTSTMHSSESEVRMWLEQRYYQ